MSKAIKLILVLFSSLFLAGSVYAGNKSILDSILQNIVIQIQGLQDKMDKLRLFQSSPAAAFSPFVRNLKVGSSGNDVKSLQEFLAKVPGLYPEKIISGYFGRLTAQALKRFQQKYQIPATGFFGPLTRAKLNDFLVSATKAPAAVSPATAAPSSSPFPPVSSVVEKMDTAGSKEELAKSGATDNDPTGDFKLQPKPDYNLKILASTTQALINKKREEASLATLLWDDLLARVALEHSQDQAKDNAGITNSDLICHYPLIRHEGFISGFTLKERLENGGVDYRSAGENIAILPVGKKFIYQYPADAPTPTCPKIEDFKSGVDTKDEATRKYNEILAQSRETVKNLALVKWVNKEWRTPEELAEKVVEGWLNSPGHRKNIMNPAFNFGGMGVVQVNDYLIFTHNFVGR